MFSRHGIQFAVCVTVALVALPSCQRNWSQPTTPAGRWKIHAGGGTYVGTRPSFSPDATLVVYSTPATGHGDLYLFDRTAGKNIRLTSDPEYDGFAFFAGDRRIVFERERGNIGHLWAMDADGSRQTQLADGPTDDAGAALSKDGRSIVFFRVRGGVSRIWIMDADGGNQRQLTDGVWFDALPHFSPDGRQVVFCRQEETTSRLTPDNGAVSLRMPEVFVINVDGTQLRRLTRNSDYDAPVSYSPDGKLVFIRHMNGVSVMDADGSQRRELASGHTPAISADGRRIVLGVYKPRGIAVMNADGSAFRVFHSCSLPHSEPALSHDGRLAAWVEWPDAHGAGTIKIMDLETLDVQTVPRVD